MFFAMLMDLNTHKTRFEYLGPFKSEKDCEKACREQNEKRQYPDNIRFIVQEMRGVDNV